MTSSVDIVSLTNTAVEALEAASSSNFITNEERPPPLNFEAIELEPEPVRDTNDAPVVTVSKENSPKDVYPEVEIVDIVETVTRQRDRTTSGQSSVTSSSLQDVPVPLRQKDEPLDDVKIVCGDVRALASRQKLASRRQNVLESDSQVKAAADDCPKIVVANLVPRKAADSPQVEPHPSQLQHLQHQARRQHENAALISAATSAAAAAAVGTQPVLKEIEQRITQLADKLANIESQRAAGTEAVAVPADLTSVGGWQADRKMSAAAPDERILRELALERELMKERERGRRREEAQRLRKEQKMQKKLLALAALRNLSRGDQPVPDRAKAPALRSKLRGRSPPKPRLLEEILHKEERETARFEEEAAEKDGGIWEKEQLEKRRMATELAEARLKEFEAKLNGELADIRAEFQDLRIRADNISTALPSRCSAPFAPAPPPEPLPESAVADRTERSERTGRLLERVGRMQENLEQNMAAIERAREAEFFYAVLNDLSGDRSAVNSAVTRIMVDDALKKATKEAQRQAEFEFRRARSSPASRLSPPAAAPPSRRRPAPAPKVDTGLRARTRRGTSPPRGDSPSPGHSPARSPLFGSMTSLVEGNLLRPGQRGNRRQGTGAPYLHFANRVRQRCRSPVMVAPREALMAPTKRTAVHSKAKVPTHRKAPPSSQIARVAQKPKPRKSKPQCRLLNFRQSSCPVDRKPHSHAIQTEEAPKMPPEHQEDFGDTASSRSEDGEGLELPGWRRPQPPQKAHLAPRKQQAPPCSVPKPPEGPSRDPLELRLRNRLEDEVIAEIVSRLGRVRETGAQTSEIETSEASSRPDSAALRQAVQEVVLSEAMRMMRRSASQRPLRAEDDEEEGPEVLLRRIPTPEATPEGPSLHEAEDYSEEFEEEEGEFEEEEEFQEHIPRAPQEATSPPFSPRRDVATPSWSAFSDEEPSELLEERSEPRQLPRTPELSPRSFSEAAPAPTPRVRPPPAPARADSAAQTVEEAGVQTAAVAEVQTEVTPRAPSPEVVSLEESETSSESLPPSDSMLSDGQWLLDRSEGQQHELCVDWAMRRQLAAAAMVPRGELTDTASSVTDFRLEEGECRRRYDPDKDLLLQLLMEQQRSGRSGRTMEAMLRLDSAGESASLGPADQESFSMSYGQVPRPVPRQKREQHRLQTAGEASAATTINEEALEDTPVRDSGGSLPPGVLRVRESLNSTGELPTAALFESQEVPSEVDTRVSDRMEIDLRQYLATSMNTTTGTGGSDDFTRTGLISTNQLIQDALLTTDLSATGDGQTLAPQRRVKVAMPTLDAVPPSGSPSPDEESISEISLKP